MWSLCSYRCILDGTVEVYHSDARTYYFGIQAFKFTGDFNEVLQNHTAMLKMLLSMNINYNTLKFCWQVYIICSVILCAEESSNSRCAQGCLREPARKRRRDVSKETDRHHIMQGPFHVARQTQHSAAGILVKSSIIMSSNDSASWSLI